jgi:Domain of unknown function (DUF4160)
VLPTVCYFAHCAMVSQSIYLHCAAIALSYLTEVGVASIKAQLSNCKIYIYPGDHNPPHFHIKGPNSNALVDMVTLKVIRGAASRKDLDEAIAWAKTPGNLEILTAEWRRLNERE